jgi:hypothetical protein
MSDEHSEYFVSGCFLHVVINRHSQMMFLNKIKRAHRHHQMKEYEINKQVDPCAHESRVVKKSFIQRKILQDGDIWFETVFRNKKTGKTKIFFVSHKTGYRIRDGESRGETGHKIYMDYVSLSIPNYLSILFISNNYYIIDQYFSRTSNWCKFGTLFDRCS